MSRSALGNPWLCRLFAPILASLLHLTLTISQFLPTASQPAAAQDPMTKDYPPSCGVCHGNPGNPAPDGTAYPDRVGAHTVHVIGTGYDKSRFPASRHGQTGQVSCGNCHTRHGSSEPSLKSARYDQNDRVTYLHGSDQYALCWQCHDENKVVRSTSASVRNAFGTLHNKHVRDERGPCIECHDPHTPWDTGEDGHISFLYPVANGWSFNLTVGGTSHTVSTSFLDTGTNKGKCYLSCHGQSHNSKSYTGVDANTLYGR